MLHSIVSVVGSDLVLGASLGTAALSAGYIYWKSKGGQLLFRAKKNDDPTTKMMKGVFAAAWAFTSVYVSMFICGGALLVALINLIARLFA